MNLIEKYKHLETNPQIWICYPTPAFPGTWEIREDIIREEVIPLISEVARLTEVKLIDSNTGFINRSELFPDKVHPSAKGANLIANTIFKEIHREFKNSL